MDEILLYRIAMDVFYQNFRNFNFRSRLFPDQLGKVHGAELPKRQQLFTAIGTDFVELSGVDRFKERCVIAGWLWIHFEICIHALHIKIHDRICMVDEIGIFYVWRPDGIEAGELLRQKDKTIQKESGNPLRKFGYLYGVEIPAPKGTQASPMDPDLPGNNAAGNEGKGSGLQKIEFFCGGEFGSGWEHPS